MKALNGSVFCAFLSSQTAQLPPPCYLEKLPTNFDGTDSIRFASMQASLQTHKSSKNHVWKRMETRVGLEAGIAFGFGFKKSCFSRKCWFSGRLRLPSIQKLLASESTLASIHAVFDGFGFGFVIFLWTASASVSASRNFVSGIRGSIGVLIRPSFTNFVSISIYLKATLFASSRLSRYLCLSCAGRKTIQCGGKGLPSIRKSSL